ncbi:MAG: hypothetical protein AAF533_05370 [Acidobacteriota bacterium]
MRPALRALLTLAPCLALAATAFAQGDTPVFPGAEGFGTTTPAGRGGQVYVVSDLGDSGTGTLRDCVEHRAPDPDYEGDARVCIFHTSGTITLESNLVVRKPYLTIAGQTAPSPGIFLQGKTLVVANTHDVLIQHLAMGPGDDDPDNFDADSLKVTGQADRVVLDHVSAYFSVDETVSFFPGGLNNPESPKDVTISNSIVAYALNRSIHRTDDTHSKSLLVGPLSENITVRRCLIAHGNNRNPRVTGALHCEVLNNLVYNRGVRGLEIEDGRDEYGNPTVHLAVVGNSFWTGQDTGMQPPIIVAEETTQGSTVYLHDNSEDGVLPDDAWDELTVAMADETLEPRIRVEVESYDWGSGAEILVNDAVADAVIATAGSHSGFRGEIDEELMGQVGRAVAGEGTPGNIVNCMNPNGTRRCDNNMGGWPDYPAVVRVLELPPDPDGDAGNGYTNLEVWLHCHARLVEGLECED